MATKKKYKDYESAMERLEAITDQLEAGDPKLEDAINLYTEGLEIAKFCNEKLNEADGKIKIIAEKNGTFEEEEFEEGDE
jgi:exodeoxyribonuclease VII small subunit